MSSMDPTPVPEADGSPAPGAARIGLFLRSAVEAPGPDDEIGAIQVEEGRRLYPAERFAWTLVWFGVMVGGFNLWHFWWAGPIASALAPLLVIVGILGVLGSWLVSSPRLRGLQLGGMVAAMSGASASQSIAIHTRHFYLTDAAAFDDLAARTLLHGRDPYTTSMAAAASMFSEPARYWTYTVTGGHVTHVSYPAGSFLVDIPALILGVHHQTVDWVDLTAWLLSVVVLFALLPSSLRWVAGLLAVSPLFIGMFSSGGTDAAVIPFLILATWRWDRFATGRAAGIANWLGPVALGVACTIKQLAWFCLPFLVIGIALEARRSGRPPVGTAARYVAIVAGIFTLVNAPFIVWAPAAWLKGTLTPFIEPMVADGQGLVSLATHGITGGVNLSLLDVAAVFALLGTLVSFVVWYSVLKRAWPLLVPVVFFFAPRSLSSYLVDLFPVAAVALFTVKPVGRVVDVQGPRAPTSSPTVRPRSSLQFLRASFARAGARSMRALVALPVLGVAIASALAFVGPPMQLEVRSVSTTKHGSALSGLTVVVTNRTGSTITPHFLVNAGDNPAGFWTPADHRPFVVGPHASETVRLDPPPHATATAPQFGARWLVEAYDANPRSLSTSPLMVWTGRRHAAGG